MALGGYLRAVVFKHLPHSCLFGRKHWASRCGHWFGSWRSLCTAPCIGLASEANLRTTATVVDGKPSPSLAVLQPEGASWSQDAGARLHIALSSTGPYPRLIVGQISFLVSCPEIAKIQSIYNHHTLRFSEQQWSGSGSSAAAVTCETRVCIHVRVNELPREFGSSGTSNLQVIIFHGVFS